jgi:CubicO group peptidase (beta-lactamase class C family)
MNLHGAVDALVDEMFDEAGSLTTTYACVVVHRGEVIAERYGNALPHFDRPPTPVDASTPLRSWSMAKSMLHAVIGMLIGDGVLELDAPAPVPAWQDDDRAAITLDDLLSMRDGLDWVEDYVDADRSDVIEMLFGSGQDDVAGFAEARALAVPPGTRFNYSSGTSNVLSAIVGRALGGRDAVDRFLHDRLFGPLGMTSAVPTFDAAGTWVASSYVDAIARDYVPFGQLYLDDGVVDGRRILPEGWAASGTDPRSIDPEDCTLHGRHWWATGDGHGTFWAAGYDGQSVLVSPALDLVAVRLGATPAARSALLRDWRARLVGVVALAG